MAAPACKIMQVVHVEWLAPARVSDNENKTLILLGAKGRVVLVSFYSLIKQKILPHVE